MKTILYSGCYLDGKDGLNNSRLQRNIRYVDYYYSIKNIIGFDDIFMLDNGSSYLKMTDFLGSINMEYFKIKSVENIGEGEANQYPYCWRALYYIKNLIEEGYEKIVVIDSDGFVVSKKLADYINNLSSGWNSFWCKRWDFPEASIHVLCKDAFNMFFNFIKIPYQNRVGSIMEITLPFTHIEEQFNCDRFGETNDPFTNDIDYYGQAGPEFVPKMIGG